MKLKDVLIGLFKCGNTVALKAKYSRQKPMGHCKDCVNFLNNHICLRWSKYGTIEVNSDDFCSNFEQLK